MEEKWKITKLNIDWIFEEKGQKKIFNQIILQLNKDSKFLRKNANLVMVVNTNKRFGNVNVVKEMQDYLKKDENKQLKDARKLVCAYEMTKKGRISKFLNIHNIWLLLKYDIVKKQRIKLVHVGFFTEKLFKLFKNKIYLLSNFSNPLKRISGS